jgi:hypothetical protein
MEPQESPSFKRTASYFLRNLESGSAKGESPSPMPLKHQPRPIITTYGQSATGAGALMPYGDNAIKAPFTFGSGGRYTSRKVLSETSRKRVSINSSSSRSKRLKRLRTATLTTSREAKLTGPLGMLPTEVRQPS